MNLPAFTLNNRSLVTLLLLLVTFMGLVSFNQMSRREDPDVRVTVALIVTIWPGSSAEKVERFISVPIEERALEIGEVEVVTSTTRDNISVVFINAAHRSDPNKIFQQFRNRLAEIDFPDGVIGPDIYDDFGDVTSMIWAIASETASPGELSDWAEKFEQRLRMIDSVGKIVRLCEQREAIYIEGPLESFTQYSFSPVSAARILDSQNVTIPSGYIRTRDTNLRMETSGEFSALDLIRDAVIDVSRDSGHPLRVSDVFDVRRGYREPPIQLMLANGVPAVGLDVRMRKGHNIVELGESVRSAAEEFKETLPPHMNLILLHDQPDQVDSFVSGFMNNLIQGLFIVIVVIFLAMGIRTAGIVALSLPLSIIFTFAVMPIFKVDLEIVSIGAFIVALGMLVDNAIIVTENISVHLQRGLSPKKAAVVGAQEIVGPVISGTMATVCAFLPLLLMGDEIGEYIESLPIVVSVSLLASLVLALTLTPMLAAWWMRSNPKRPAPGASIPTMLYGRMMGWVLQLRYLIILAALLSLAGAALLAGVVGFSFFPEAFRNQFTVSVWLPESSSIEQTHRTIREVIEIIDRDPVVTSHVAYVGTGGPRFHITVKPEFTTANYGQLLVNTTDPAHTPAAIDRLNDQFRTQIAGAQITAEPLYMGIPVDAPIAVRIFGPDLDVMRELSELVQDALRSVPGSYMVRDTLGEDNVSLKIDVDGSAALVSGITQTEVALALLSTYEGLPVTSLRDGDSAVDVFLRLSEEDRTLDTLESIQIPSFATGEKVPLAAFATIEPQWKMARIQRRDGRRTITVMSWAHGRLTDDVLQDALPMINAINVPRGYRLELAGEHVQRVKAFEGLTIVFGVILALILLMLVVQFKSIVRALVILFSVPLAIVGALIGLYLSNESISLMAFLGVASLAGMVIKNAVVWVEFVDRAVEQGKGMHEAVIEAGQMRLRPILLTASTTIGALFPLALYGGVLWRGMAWAMICGLALATILTLVVIPCLYYTLFRDRKSSTIDVSKTSKNAASAASLFLLALSAYIPDTALALTHDARGIAAATHPLLEYVRAAAGESKPVMGAHLDLEEAKMDRMMARFSLLPQAQLLATMTRLDDAQELQIDTSEFPIPVDVPPMVLANRNIYRMGTTLTFPIFTGGRRLAYIQAAKQGVSARKHILSAVEAGVAFGTAASYVKVLEASARVRILEDALATDRMFVQIARTKQEFDMAVPFDVSYAEVRAADTERLLVMAISEKRQIRRSFNDLVGQDLNEPISLQSISFDPSFSPSIEDLLEGFAQRPELSAFERGVIAQDAMVRAAMGELLPSVAMVGEGGYRDGEIGYLNGGRYWTITAAMQVNLDPLSFGRLQKARLEARRAEHNRDEERQRMLLELYQAFELHQDTFEILSVANRAVDTAIEGFQNAQTAYKEGVLDIATVLEASKALAQAREGLVRAYHARVLAELQLRYRGGMDILSDANLKASKPLQSSFMRPDVQEDIRLDYLDDNNGEEGDR